MESAFFRLHPALQHAIVHDLGWRSLRPVQEQTAAAVLDGANAVVLAPTAGGKTEASLFPVLSQILTDQSLPVSALYICPIRALLNNQEPRVMRYARMVGLDAFKWHGDVAASARQRFQRHPAHVLMITPESLEVMLVSARVDAERLFGGLRAVVVDEVHAFAADDRGAHLASILERLTRICGRDVQRIGLSATVGNPGEIARWLQGSSERPSRVIDPPKEDATRDLLVDLLDGTDAAAKAAAKLGLGRKTLVFVDSRADAERVAAAMADRGVDVFIHHSSVSPQSRRQAEERFAEGGTNAAIVCTSTMELGIDVGDLDHVVQIDAPATVASLLQRMGRTGRRIGTRTNCTLLCRKPEALLQAVGLVRLMESGWVEDVRPDYRAAHILAHQILALTLQEGGGLSRHRITHWVRGAAAFRDLTESTVVDLVETMLARDILYESEGLLSLGSEGERLYGRRNFMELYAVFDSPTMLRVLHGGSEIGVVQSRFVLSLFDRDEPPSFRLAGRAWQLTETDLRRGLVHVKAVEAGRVPTWMGTPSHLSYEVCQSIRATLADTADHSWLTQRARDDLAALRESYAPVLDKAEAPVEVNPDDGTTWHTFAGGAANTLLVEALRRTTRRRWTTGNLSIRSRETTSPAEAVRFVGDLCDLDWSDEARALRRRDGDSISKFEPCLPEALCAELFIARRLDVAAAARVAAARSSVLGAVVTACAASGGGEQDGGG